MGDTSPAKTGAVVPALKDAPAAARPQPGKRARIFVAIALLLMLLPLSFGFNPFGAPPLPSLDWTLLMDQRRSAAAEKMHGQKVIFIGGSNLIFGLNDESLSKRLQRPVLNYGLHASLGIDLIADRASRFIQRGDIVVYAPELSHFRGGSAKGQAGFSDDLRIDFLAEHPSPAIDPRLQEFPMREWRRARSRCNRIRNKVEKIARTFIVQHLPNSASETSAEHPETLVSSYTLDAVGPTGRLVAPRPGPRPMSRWTFSYPPESVEMMNLKDGRGVRAFELLSKICTERGATLLVMPPMRTAVAAYDQAMASAVEQRWLKYAVDHGAQLLLQSGENVLDPRYGFDTDYHLNEKGVALMESRLERALRPYLDGSHRNP